MRDYYKVLGVRKDISQKELKKHYYKLAKKYHPDTADNKISAEKKFKEITEAYNALSTIDKRRNYEMRGRGMVFTSGFSSAPTKSKREIIMVRLQMRTDFSIQNFASELRVNYFNLEKILKKFIDLMDIDGKIENGKVIF